MITATASLSKLSDVFEVDEMAKHGYQTHAHSEDLSAWEPRATNTHEFMYSGCGIIPLPLCSQPPVPLFTCQTLHTLKNLWRQEGLYYTRHDTLAGA